MYHLSHYCGSTKKHHKLVHHLLQKRLNSSIPWEGRKPATLATVPPYSEAYIPASLLRPAHGGLIPKLIFHAQKKTSLATRLCAWYYLNCIQNSSNCAHLCRRSSLSLVYQFSHLSFHLIRCKYCLCTKHSCHGLTHFFQPLFFYASLYSSIVTISWQ